MNANLWEGKAVYCLKLEASVSEREPPKGEWKKRLQISIVSERRGWLFLEDRPTYFTVSCCDMEVHEIGSWLKTIYG